MTEFSGSRHAKNVAVQTYRLLHVVGQLPQRFTGILCLQNLVLVMGVVGEVRKTMAVMG